MHTNRHLHVLCNIIFTSRSKKSSVQATAAKTVKALASRPLSGMSEQSVDHTGPGSDSDLHTKFQFFGDSVNKSF